MRGGVRAAAGLAVLVGCCGLLSLLYSPLHPPSPAWPPDIASQLAWRGVPGTRERVILLLGPGWEHLPPGRQVFRNKRCAVNTCSLTTSLAAAAEADLVISRGPPDPALTRTALGLRPDQPWLAHQLESAVSQPALPAGATWSATYRRDSTLPSPYGWWKAGGEEGPRPARRDWVGGRQVRAAWFVSNCHAANQRLEYGRELGRHFPVDMVGSCAGRGSAAVCPRGEAAACWDRVAANYMFYLAFENSNCMDYITEKFWNALKHKV